ncbi:immunoglobulin superfamily member 5 [Fundulus heteroclitus]|uniref:immunoglobulin superfamily member 5 n=1 Tax=Fundulus heteroclitus TaxID=8078 RepID=UPI00165AC8D3|nr:immunoglobulin superfamily member 5 [Fundulus heteroclitus]XP_021173543.2 immunoglobulin superfamily member 5 [Fundulus heteroclitus]
MIASWKIWFGLMSICLLQYRVVSQKFQLEPQNSTVLQGSDVQFKATIQEDWKVTTWHIGALQALTVINVPESILPAFDRFSGRFCSNGTKSCVEFTIHNVTRTDEGEVTCTVQGHPPQKAQLYVQESGTVRILGENVTVLQDEQVEFECVTAAWFPAPTISWTQNNQTVDSSVYNNTSINNGDFFNSTSILKLKAAGNTRVDCLATVSALATPKTSSVYVVVVPKPADWTVLIAVVASFGSCALLVLLILGILFCYKHRKEKEQNYQDEMRRVRTPSQLSVVSAVEQIPGQVNNSYEPEYQNNTTNVGVEPGFVKHRHVTIV